MRNIVEHIEAGYRYLVIELITGQTRLMRREDVFRRPGGTGLMQFVIVDLATIVQRFEEEAPPREAFTLSEVAVMAQQKGPTVHAWIKAGMLTPSIRGRDGTRGRAMLFSRRDAFVACLLASLKRKCGLPLSKLRAVSEVLGREGVGEERTAKAGREASVRRRAAGRERRTRGPCDERRRNRGRRELVG